MACRSRVGLRRCAFTPVLWWPPFRRPATWPCAARGIQNESFWLAAHTTRTALAAALAEPVRERAITQDKALALARLYPLDNAAKLYGTGGAK